MKTLLLSLLIAVGCYAQTSGANVINQSAISRSGAVSLPVTLTSSALQNIGQTNHVLVLLVSVATGGTFSGTLSVQGSVNGTLWFDIGQPQQPLDLTQTQLPYRAYGFGSYPFVRARLAITGTGTSLSLNVTYLGYSVPVNTLVDYYSTLNPLLNVSNGTLVTGAVLTGLVNHTDATHQIALYSLSVFSDAAGTTLNIGCGTVGIGTVDVLILSNLGTTRTFLIGPSVRPIVTCGPGQDITYTLAGTPVVTANVQYRYE